MGVDLDLQRETALYNSQDSPLEVNNSRKRGLDCRLTAAVTENCVAMLKNTILDVQKDCGQF